MFSRSKTALYSGVKVSLSALECNRHMMQCIILFSLDQGLSQPKIISFGRENKLIHFNDNQFFWSTYKILGQELELRRYLPNFEGKF